VELQAISKICLSVKGELKDVSAFHSKLSGLYSSTKDCIGSSIYLDIAQVSHFGVHLVAPFRAWIEGLKSQQNTIHITWPHSSEVCTSLERIGLYKDLGGTGNSSQHPTTISQSLFYHADGEAFYRWLTHEVLGNELTAHLNKALKDRTIGKLVDVFANYRQHSQTTLPFVASGQFYPKKKKLSLSLSDWGCGFLGKISTQVSSIHTPEQALRWAMVRGHSTMPPGEESGLGLHQLEGFCRNYDGWFKLVSDGGILSTHGNTMGNYGFAQTGHHPGTTIHLTISTLK
jgi:hypothetical protein